MLQILTEFALLYYATSMLPFIELYCQATVPIADEFCWVYPFFLNKNSANLIMYVATQIVYETYDT